MILEICAFNIQSALIAQAAGAHRVELCDNPAEGGTTCSRGAIEVAREKLTIALFPIIRPRGGDYFYDDEEFEIMRRDILYCREIGCNGISVGCQNEHGHIDVERLKQVVQWAYPMEVTCNRAFDAVPDARKGLEDSIASGCQRVLTSGQQSSALEGVGLLGDLVKQADGRIVIMPGAGVRSANIQQLKQQTGASEFHTSARKNDPRKQRTNPNVLDNGQLVIVDEAEVKQILHYLHNA